MTVPGNLQSDNPGITITAGATLYMNRLVKADGTYCGVGTTHDWIGSTIAPMSFLGTTVASGERVGVRLPHAGTHRLTAAATIAIGDVVYKDANGTVGTTSSSNTRIGLALSAAASGDPVEVLFD